MFYGRSAITCQAFVADIDVDFKLLFLESRLWINDGTDIRNQIGKLERFICQGQFATFDFGHVQNIVDQHHQVAR